MRAQRDGIAIEYTDQGRGLPVVLLHGLTDLLPNLAGFIRTWG